MIEDDPYELDFRRRSRPDHPIPINYSDNGYQGRLEPKNFTGKRRDPESKEKKSTLLIGRGLVNTPSHKVVRVTHS